MRIQKSYKSSIQTRNCIFFFFNDGRTSKNQIGKKTLVFIAFPLQKIRFCILKNAIDTTALYCLDFGKHYKNQCFFNDFPAQSMILAHRAIAHLNPKNAKFHWFFNGFWIFRFRAKIAHLATFGHLGGLDLVLSLSTHAVFQKSYKFPIDFAQNAIYDHLFCLQVGSKSGVIVDAKNAPGCSQTHFFAFLSIIKSIDI